MVVSCLRHACRNQHRPAGCDVHQCLHTSSMSWSRAPPHSSSTARCTGWGCSQRASTTVAWRWWWRGRVSVQHRASGGRGRRSTRTVNRWLNLSRVAGGPSPHMCERGGAWRSSARCCRPPCAMGAAGGGSGAPPPAHEGVPVVIPPGPHGKVFGVAVEVLGDPQEALIVAVTQELGEVGLQLGPAGGRGGVADRVVGREDGVGQGDAVLEVEEQAPQGDRRWFARVDEEHDHLGGTSVWTDGRLCPTKRPGRQTHPAAVGGEGVGDGRDAELQDGFDAVGRPHGGGKPREAVGERHAVAHQEPVAVQQGHRVEQAGLDGGGGRGDLQQRLDGEWWCRSSLSRGDRQLGGRRAGGRRRRAGPPARGRGGRPASPARRCRLGAQETFVHTTPAGGRRTVRATRRGIERTVSSRSGHQRCDIASSSNMVSRKSMRVSFWAARFCRTRQSALTSTRGTTL